LPTSEKVSNKGISLGWKKHLPLIAEIWIFATIATFIVVRVVGSNSAKHILHVIQGR